jgi:hypothetical protein
MMGRGPFRISVCEEKRFRLLGPDGRTTVLFNEDLIELQPGQKLDSEQLIAVNISPAERERGSG